MDANINDPQTITSQKPTKFIHSLFRSNLTLNCTVRVHFKHSNGLSWTSNFSTANHWIILYFPLQSPSSFRVTLHQKSQSEHTWRIPQKNIHSPCNFQGIYYKQNYDRSLILFCPAQLLVGFTLIPWPFLSNCVLLCRTGSYCVILCRAVSYWVVLCHTAPYCVILCRTASYCVILCRTASYCVVLCHTVSYCAILCRTACGKNWMNDGPKGRGHSPRVPGPSGPLSSGPLFSGHMAVSSDVLQLSGHDYDRWEAQSSSLCRSEFGGERDDAVLSHGVGPHGGHGHCGVLKIRSFLKGKYPWLQQFLGFEVFVLQLSVGISVWWCRGANHHQWGIYVWESGVFN